MPVTPNGMLNNTDVGGLTTLEVVELAIKLEAVV